MRNYSMLKEKTEKLKLKMFYVSYVLLVLINLKHINEKVQTYNLKNTGRVIGYNEEKWHWSYLPLARTLTQEYKNLIKDENINGFLGDEYVAGQDLINNYVLSINPNCI